MSAPARLALPDVTVCSADTAFVDLTVRALNISMAQVEFGDAILFSDSPRDGAFRNVKIAPLNSVIAYSHFCLRELVKHIETPYALLVQWDGYVVNPSAWARAFEKYDYIGAAWHGLFPEPHMVGNGGFSLRSKKLLKAVAGLPPIDDAYEDRFICHRNRERLERQSGIRFAPVKIADRFAYQYKVPAAIPFGFHGPHHMWRHTPDNELASVVGAIDVTKANPVHTVQTVLDCARNAHGKSAQVLYRSIRDKYPAPRVRQVLAQMMPGDQADAALAEMERLL